MFKLSLHKLKYILLTVILLELFLGGTGRLTEITSFLTLRMILFIIYMLLIVGYLFTNHTLPKEIAYLIGLFVTLIVLATVMGVEGGAGWADIFEDIKPLLNTFFICYLYFSIKTNSDIKYVLKLIKISALILAVFHLVLGCIVLKYHDMAILYSALNAQDNTISNFTFKGDNGFVNYPGDIYLCIGLIVWDQYHPKTIFKYIAIFIIAIAIILTGTRGLIIGLAAAYLIKWLFLKFNYKSLVFLVAGIAIFIGVFSQLKNNIGDKDESDAVRYEQITEVKDRITPISLFSGHGFGIGVPIRPIHMEIAYLEIFHKQGLFGLFYYLVIFTIAYLAYKKCSFKNGVGFYMFVIFIFALSFTNPYVNHPLGITVISIAIVSMFKINQLEKIQVMNLR